MRTRAGLTYVIRIDIRMSDNVRGFVHMASLWRAGVELYPRRIKVRCDACEMLEYIELVSPWTLNDLPLVCLLVEHSYENLYRCELGRLTVRYGDASNSSRTCGCVSN